MIARMVKVEIVGPAGLAVEVLSLLRELGVFQIEPDSAAFLSVEDRDKVHSLLLDDKTMGERMYYEELKERIDELFACLPRGEPRRSYLAPLTVLDSVAQTVRRHLGVCREWGRARESLQRELIELERYGAVLDLLEPHLAGLDGRSGIEFIAVTLTGPDALEEFVRMLARLTRNRFEIATPRTADGTLMALVTLEKGEADKVRAALGEQRVPELIPPATLAAVPLAGKATALRRRKEALGCELSAIDEKRAAFAAQWGALYWGVRNWLDERLTLMKNIPFLMQSDMCFFIHGWTPEQELERLEEEAGRRFAGAVVIERREILEKDLDQVPVTLRNPPFLRPFELFARLLPLPRYATLDPTPFLAIGFPLFFGMILGDAGYGAVLLLISLVLVRRASRGDLRDAGKILLVCSCYAIVFGFLYGECFGAWGAQLLGMEKPLLVERRRAILPMLLLAVSIGAVHVVIGLALGVVTALRRRTGKEALFKVVNIAAILCMAGAILSLVEVFPRAFAPPLVFTLLALIPALIFSGGLLAPFELMKHVGNIVSYARIMAIGLASVLLARVANSFAGLTGNVVAGVLLALLFHAINLVLGVFSPALHALRLHYVEFYSKFMIGGGRKFEPLKK